ncbi:TPA: lasso peptide biosynthesis B2 protein [Stenotrophomonas maltophilia]|nr:lasso peptide biosynthesis B2 protein [Stenotrophomonas maltophilia]
MHVQLHEDLSFCRVDGHAIFLDLQRNRYFRLPNALERSFLSYVEGDAEHEIDVDALLARNILIPAPGCARRPFFVPIGLPARSAVEQVFDAARVPLGTLLDVFAIVCSTRLQLATRKLNDILTELIAFRGRWASPPPAVLTEIDVEALSDAAAIFSRARPYVPIETRCLLDSISMVKFLAKRRLSANIVFGVTGEPFSAHCWVQTGDLVLNETVGDAAALTPIRTI